MADQTSERGRSGNTATSLIIEVVGFVAFCAALYAFYRP